MDDHPERRFKVRGASGAEVFKINYDIVLQEATFHPLPPTPFLIQVLVAIKDPTHNSIV